MSARASAAAAARISRRLSARDHEILDSLSRVRLLGALQLQRIHFNDGSQLSRARRCRRVLARLHGDGLLQRLERRVGGLHAGSAGYIYALSSLGQRVAGARGPAGGQRNRRPWEPSPSFQDHVLEVAEVYAQLRQADASNELEQISFTAEPACWRQFTGSGGQVVTLKPDAYVRVGTSEFEQVSFVEVDRDTEHMPTIRRKLAVYVAARAAGVDSDQGIFPSVVWIVPDTKRAEQITREIERLPDVEHDLFEVTTKHNQLQTLKGITP